uniref:rRNA N-glycosylase n=1 Tax=Beta vulgaris TaxID=161934 RepID=Q1H8N0_BETVU|nr:ribosome-inactivating protein [Beta vulgaris]
MKALTAARWIQWCIIMVVVIVPITATTTEDEAVGKKLSYTTVTFELKYGVEPLKGYSSFLTRLRNAVEAPTRACGLQFTRKVPLTGKQYVLVDLKFSNTQWVTLGIDAKDLYVWAYQDNVKYNGKFRANFLGDAPQSAKNSLFPGSTKRTTRFGGNYNSLEPAAGVTRNNIVLGTQNLDGAIKRVYGKQEGVLNQGKDEAKFFLIAIQMVAEAARFKFMEQGIVKGDKTTAFKAKMVAFQNDWDPISQAIHRAEAAARKCTTISPTLVISNTGYRQEVNRVDAVKNDMGLLKYKSIGSSVVNSILADDGGSSLEFLESAVL